jgi:hypothetical protein
LWVISGRASLKLQCPLYSQKRTSLSAAAMSALCQKATSNGLLDRFLKSIKSRVIYCKAMVHAGNTDIRPENQPVLFEE